MPAADGDRRQILRELHDGIGPTLVAVALGIEATSRLLGSGHAGETLLTRLHAELQDAITEIQRLGEQLRPPALDRADLATAIRGYAGELAGRCVAGDGAAGPLQITVDTPAVMPSLPPAVELAAYRITCEALANVTRHAGASNCRVRLWVVDGELRIEVVDNGVGLAQDAGARRGVGLWSMRERAAEVGGDCTIEPDGRLHHGAAGQPDRAGTGGPTGTRVLAALPIGRPAVATH